MRRSALAIVLTLGMPAMADAPWAPEPGPCPSVLTGPYVLQIGPDEVAIKPPKPDQPGYIAVNGHVTPITHQDILEAQAFVRGIKPLWQADLSAFEEAESHLLVPEWFKATVQASWSDWDDPCISPCSDALEASLGAGVFWVAIASTSGTAGPALIIPALILSDLAAFQAVRCFECLTDSGTNCPDGSYWSDQAQDCLCDEGCYYQGTGFGCACEACPGWPNACDCDSAWGFC